MNRTLALRIATAAVIGALLAGLLYFTPKVVPASAKKYALVLQGAALVSGAPLMTVNQDDTVTLQVKSDRGGQIMLHGYERELKGHDKELTVEAGGETTLTFVASKSGRYM